jgi:hypothetical protein
MGISDFISLTKLYDFLPPKLSTCGSLSCRSIGKLKTHSKTYEFLLTIKIFNDRKNQANRPQITKFDLFDNFRLMNSPELSDGPITNKEPIKFEIRISIDVPIDESLDLSEDEEILRLYNSLNKKFKIKLSYYGEIRKHVTEFEGMLTLGPKRIFSVGW